MLIGHAKDVTMRSALLTGPGEVELTRMHAPKLGKGEVLVQVEAAGICGSDLMAYQVGSPARAASDHLGHEVAGTVIELGPDTSRAFSGARVYVEPNRSCNACRYCKAGTPNVCPNYHVLREGLKFQALWLSSSPHLRHSVSFFPVRSPQLKVLLYHQWLCRTRQ